MKEFIQKILGIYLIYLAIGGVLIFGFYKPKERPDIETINFNTVNGKDADRVGLVDGSFYSGLVRVNMIRSAEETLDISYYTFHAGYAIDVFFDEIIKAADRGVKVRVFVDGIFHNMRRPGLIGSIPALASHPNIEVRFYEKPSLLRPWTFNNRLHDKMIIVDRKLALTGGRNVGDKYYVENDDYIEPVRDRDVLIYNWDNREDSIIHTMADYYSHTWDSIYTYDPYKPGKRSERQKDKYLKNMRLNVDYIKENIPQVYTTKFDLDEITLPAKNIEFVHNPIEDMGKRPWAMSRFFEIMEDAEESIFVQSPYIIPSREMKKEFNKFDIDLSKIEILTNSYYSTPNFPAFSGYHNHRKKLAKTDMKINEYQGEDSIHAKTYIIDERKSIIGSLNLDPRSAYLSTESYVVIDSKEFAEDLENTIGGYLDEALLVDKDGNYVEEDKAKDVPKIKMLLIRIISKVVYFFEYML